MLYSPVKKGYTPLIYMTIGEY